MTSWVPTVDLRLLDAVEQIDRACRTVGFFQCTGHGLDLGFADELSAAAARYFSLPAEVKARHRAPSVTANRGWFAKGSESAAWSLGEVSAPPDLFEAFNAGGGRSAPDGVAAHLVGLYAPDVATPEAPGWGEVLRAWFDEVSALAQRLLDLATIALGLPEGWFAPHVDRAPDTLRVNSYERNGDAPPPAPGSLGMGPHTDYGVLTVLLADPIAGLEVADATGGWHPVTAAPGAVVVNVGDLLAQWTNDTWVSSLHRVQPPAAAPGTTVVRRSVPFFKEANADAVVAALPGCTGPGRPARYPPVVAGEHLLAKLIGPRTAAPATTVSTAGTRVTTIGR